MLSTFKIVIKTHFLVTINVLSIDHILNLHNFPPTQPSFKQKQKTLNG